MRENENIIYAINSIKPGAGFTVAGTYESLIWDEGQEQDKPTEKEFNDAVTAWKEEYDAQEYARKREAEYPSIADQLDEIYHNGIDSWKAVIKVTKDKHPKG